MTRIRETPLHVHRRNEYENHTCIDTPSLSLSLSFSFSLSLSLFLSRTRTYIHVHVHVHFTVNRKYTLLSGSSSRRDSPKRKTVNFKLRFGRGVRPSLPPSIIRFPRFFLSSFGNGVAEPRSNMAETTRKVTSVENSTIDGEGWFALYGVV